VATPTPPAGGVVAGGRRCGVAAAGIGFPVSPFVPSLSSRAGGGLEDLAKLGVLLGSLVSGVIGAWALSRALGPAGRHPAADAEPAA